MTESDPERPAPRSSSWHRRRPGIRYLYSAAAIIGGIVIALRFAGGESAGLVWVGIAVVTLGVASIPVYWWMDKRRL